MLSHDSAVIADWGRHWQAARDMRHKHSRKRSRNRQKLLGRDKSATERNLLKRRNLEIPDASR